MTKRKRYSAEFKRQVLRRAAEPGVTDALVCEELGVSTRQLHDGRIWFTNTVNRRLSRGMVRVGMMN